MEILRTKARSGDDEQARFCVIARGGAMTIPRKRLQSGVVG